MTRDRNVVQNDRSGPAVGVTVEHEYCAGWHGRWKQSRIEELSCGLSCGLSFGNSNTLVGL